MENKIRKFAKKGLSIPEIAKKIKMSYSFVYARCVEYKITVVDGRIKSSKLNSKKLQKIKGNNLKNAIKLYNSGHSLKFVGNKFGVSGSTILNTFRREGIQTRLQNGKTELKQPKVSKELLERLYWSEKKSLTEIVKECGYNYPTEVKDDMIRHDIKRRNYSDAGKNMFNQRPEIKQKIIDGMGETFTKFLQGSPSSLELQFINWCNKTNIEYIHQYQIKESPLKHNYDFFLKNYNLLVEIDGDYWHLKEESIIRDSLFDENAEMYGYNIIRFLGSTIKETKGKCFDDIIGKYDD